MVNKSKNRLKLNNSGFSLIELLVTLAVMVVLMTASLITYRVVSKQNVKKAAADVEEYLTTAKEKAMSVNAYEWNLTIDSTGSADKLELIEASLDAAGNRTENVKDSMTLPANVEIKIVDKNGNPTLLDNGTTGKKKFSIAFTSLTGTVSKTFYDGAASTNISWPDNYFDIVVYYKNNKSKTIRVFTTTGKYAALD